MKQFVLTAVLLILATLGSLNLAHSSPPASTMASSDLCAPLDPPTGPTVSVDTVAELENAVNTAVSGDTILVGDGIYNLNGVYLRMAVPNVTLRSASGSREAVVLDGNYITTEIIQVVASNVTIADITLREAYYHPIHVMSGDTSDTLNTRIYNVHIIDPGEQAIKINPAAENTYPDNGLIACSHVELTDAGRPHIRNNCYTGGVDAHQAEGWVIRDNLIEGFWCASGLSEHGIHLWRGCRDTLVERNVLNDNARGIGFGLATSGDARTYADNPCPSAGGGYVDHYGGIIRNNFVFANQAGLFASQYGFDCGICLWQACGAQVFNNTVASTTAPFSSIEWRFDNTVVEIKNNLVSHNLRDRGGSSVLANNLENAPLTLFVDGANGDLHLQETAVTAVDQAVSLVEVTDDVDGDGRFSGVGPDIGADEYLPSLNLFAAPANGAAYLTWEVRGSLPVTATWQITYQASGVPPSSITGMANGTRAYTLTGLTNYTLYTMTLNAMVEGTAVLTATATVMPTDLFVFLPVVLND
jgi:hypothetical protein